MATANHTTHRYECLSKSDRLTNNRDFRETYAQGHRWVGHTMVLWIRKGDDTHQRLGVVASKKVGHAVHRARAKRLLREAFRQHRKQCISNDDIVLVARQNILRASWDQIVTDLQTLLSKAGLIETQ